MKINLLNPMILAENYEELAEWYEKTFDLAIKTRVEEGEEHMELGTPSKILFGFARAKEMGVKPSTPRNNAVIIQLSVNDINELFDKVEKTGGKILFGPSISEEEGYLYGGLADIEGNQIWVIERRGD